MKPVAQIEDYLMGNIEVICELLSSLDNEFEYILTGEFGKERDLAAKKKQIARLNFIKANNSKMCELLYLVVKDIYKMNACMIYHGLTPLEIDQFVKRELPVVDRDLDRFKVDGFIQVPEQILPFIGAKKEEVEPFREIRYADKPMLPIDFLEKMAQSFKLKLTANEKIK